MLQKFHLVINIIISDFLPTIAYSDSFLFETVLFPEVELEIVLAPSGKAHGLYSCPSRILKCSRDIIAKPLTTLINVSVQNGRFPSRLKPAKIVPVFKDGDGTDPCNYRPILLLSLFNRSFEKIVSN